MERINWQRFSIEGAVIVASILLAFSIEAWWGDRQDGLIAESLLRSVLSEIETNITVVETNNNHRSAVEKSIMELFEMAESPSLNSISIDEHLGSLLWYGAAQVTWSSLESLINGEQLTLIENIDLRQSLVRLYRFRYFFEELSNLEDREFAQDVMFPYLRTRAFLPQLGNTASAQIFPGTNSRSYDYDIPLSQNKDHSTLLEDPEFLGILIEKLWIQLDSANRNNSFINEASLLTDRLRQILS